MTLGVAGMVGLYTVLATIAATASTLHERFDEMYGTTHGLHVVTPGMVLVAWMATLAIVVLIPMSKSPLDTLFGHAILHVFLTLGWFLAAIYPFVPLGRCHLTLT